MTASRLWIAIASYAALGLMAAFTLERTPRILVWLILGALAVKTWIVWIKHRPE
jgi:diacylglycerol kinase